MISVAAAAPVTRRAAAGTIVSISGSFGTRASSWITSIRTSAGLSLSNEPEGTATRCSTFFASVRAPASFSGDSLAAMADARRLGARGRVEAGVAAALAALPRSLARVLAGRPVRVDGQQLDVQVQLAIRLERLLGGWEPRPAPEARAHRLHEAMVFRGPTIEVGHVRDLELPGPEGPIGARLYEPAAGSAPRPLVVYFHGGGHVIGDLDTHDQPCRFLARETPRPRAGGRLPARARTPLPGRRRRRARRVSLGARRGRDARRRPGADRGCRRQRGRQPGRRGRPARRRGGRARPRLPGAALPGHRLLGQASFVRALRRGLLPHPARRWTGFATTTSPAPISARTRVRHRCSRADLAGVAARPHRHRRLRPAPRRGRGLRPAPARARRADRPCAASATSSTASSTRSASAAGRARPPPPSPRPCARASASSLQARTALRTRRLRSRSAAIGESPRSRRPGPARCDRSPHSFAGWRPWARSTRPARR